jgi:hypothetical protein
MIKLNPKDKRKPRTVRLSDKEVAMIRKASKIQLAIFYREAILDKAQKELKVFHR